jgi:signal transduction histidine kinase/ActR/RegA family two-component response regulator
MPRDQAEGWGWQAAHDPATLPAVMDAWRASLGTGMPFEMEFPLRGRDGRFRVFLTRTVPVRNARGDIVHWFGTNTDVQYRLDAERALEEHAETLATLNRAGEQLAGELNLERVVQAVADAGTRLTRAQVGAFFYNVVGADGAAQMLYTLSGISPDRFAHFPMPRDTAVFGPTFHGEGVVRSDDITKDPRYGHNAPYNGVPPGHVPVRSYLAVPVASRAGEVLGGLFFGHPEVGVFTARDEAVIAGLASQAAIAIDNARLYRRIQELLESERAARADAERVNRTKDEFLASLSHELRTPLNAVIGWTHLIRGGHLSEEKTRRALETIERNAAIQSRLVEDLLDMSRIVTGRIQIGMEAIDLRGVVQESLAVVRPTADAKGVSIDAVVGESPVRIKGDPHRLQQVLWNVLANAVKFTPAGGQVQVTLSTVDGRAELVVSDTGIGIDPTFLPFVFDRFRQADGSFTREHGGLGLGLSIVRSLVEMHAGTIEAGSAGAGLGATFTIRFPLLESAPSVGRGPDQGAVPASALAGRSILVVDDDADTRVIVTEMLQPLGAHIVCAASASEALRVLEHAEPAIDLVVSDIGMPEMDGFAFIRAARALPPASGGSVKAIALTAYAGESDRRRARAAGYDLHLAKPFAMTDLVSACAALLQPSASESLG